MMAVFLFTAHEKGFKFHALPQTGADSCLIKGHIELRKILLRKNYSMCGLGIVQPVTLGYSYSAYLLDLQRCN